MNLFKIPEIFFKGSVKQNDEWRPPTPEHSISEEKETFFDLLDQSGIHWCRYVSHERA
jgi:hypothetical protein